MTWQRRPHPRNQLPLPHELWAIWVSIIHGVFAYSAFSSSRVLDARAYHYAYGVIPQTGWGVVSLVIIAMVAWGLLSHRLGPILIAFGVALPTQLTFGLSILLLTHNLVAALQWWSVAIGCMTFVYAAWMGTLALADLEPRDHTQ